ncbi:hypothetical protein JEQ12_018545 [Ovis aries]|uniref:Uncharacterized protein n=1 Tax=Ovis aries TaxID=9940 RepID=A0A836AA55_SHEEP|nr:hypothetical protein JEQ12_018545 [Ovis aries]
MGPPGPPGLSSGPLACPEELHVFPVTDSLACISEVPSGLTVILQADSDADFTGLEHHRKSLRRSILTPCIFQPLSTLLFYENILFAQTVSWDPIRQEALQPYQLQLGADLGFSERIRLRDTVCRDGPPGGLGTAKQRGPRGTCYERGEAPGHPDEGSASGSLRLPLAQSTRWSGSELRAQDSDELLTLAPYLLALWSDLPATEPRKESLFHAAARSVFQKRSFRLTFLLSERAPDCLARGPLQALGTQGFACFVYDFIASNQLPVRNSTEEDCLRNLEHLHLRISFVYKAKPAKGLSVLDQNEIWWGGRELCCGEQGSPGAVERGSPCRGLSPGACALGSAGFAAAARGLGAASPGSRAQARGWWRTGLAAPRPVRSSWTRDGARVPSTGRRFLPTDPPGEPVFVVFGKLRSIFLSTVIGTFALPIKASAVLTDAVAVVKGPGSQDHWDGIRSCVW